MKKHSLLIAGSCMLLASCVTTTTTLYLESYSPEESSLNMVKITDESTTPVIAGLASWYPNNTYNNNTYININSPKGLITTPATLFTWSTHPVLAISPDGKKLAYCTRNNGQDNVMVRNTGAQGMTTQRTFRNVHSFCWGNDGNLYFSDMNGGNLYICSVNAEQGSMMNQHTNGNVKDISPVISHDGKTIFFTRLGNGAPSIWSLNKENGTLTLCAHGYNPCLIPGNNEAFYCVRNSTMGRSEIWYVNYVKGQESLVVADANKSFTNPALSPDGRWLLCVGNSHSNITGKQNLDVYVVRTDGSRLTQLTYHPETDTCPVWAKDGRSIFFISTRANKERNCNVWRMNFDLE